MLKTLGDFNSAPPCLKVGCGEAKKPNEINYSAIPHPLPPTGVFPCAEYPVGQPSVLPYGVNAFGKESYKHYFAKHTLANWLREVTDGDCGRIGNFQWTSNRGSTAHKGVWVEYPVGVDMRGDLVGFYPVWDELEFDCEQARAAPDGFIEDVVCFNARPPTYQEATEIAQCCPVCVFDVAVQYKGQLHIAFEVVHKHAVGSLKRAYLSRMPDLRVAEIDADWILSQTSRPAELQCRWVRRP